MGIWVCGGGVGCACVCIFRKREGNSIGIILYRGAGKARFNVATPTNATVTCTAYVLPYNLQTKSI